ncbi:hypothetical protein PIB30_002853 [Stylosanthes scabra]|uniref:Uncharacterized protein n=1 Tax=Stylosanthes scabra TaxID=79078 RepID=A0ABU6T2T7_9FABA|nr:hypothetical protein [Stylosanthes scabra]
MMAPANKTEGDPSRRRLEDREKRNEGQRERDEKKERRAGEEGKGLPPFRRRHCQRSKQKPSPSPSILLAWEKTRRLGGDHTVCEILVGNGEALIEKTCSGYLPEVYHLKRMGDESMFFDSFVLEAQIALSKCLRDQKDENNENGPPLIKNVGHGNEPHLFNEESHNSADSLPFPLGFEHGPVREPNPCHGVNPYEQIRVLQAAPKLVENENTLEGGGNVFQPEQVEPLGDTQSECVAVDRVEQCRRSDVDESRDMSDEMLYLINKWENEGIRFDDGRTDEVNSACLLVNGLDGIETESEEYSDKTLYRLPSDELGRDEDLQSLADFEVEGDKGADELGCDNDIVGQGDRQSDVSSEEEDSVEAGEARSVWNRSGIGFESSDEEEILERLVRRKIEGKRRPDLRPKSTKQGRKPPCIQGRTLATRKLSLGSKPKTK